MSGGGVDILIHHPNFEIDLDDRLIGVQGCWCVGYGGGKTRSNLCRYKQKKVNKQRQFSCIKQREMTAIIMTKVIGQCRLYDKFQSECVHRPLRVSPYGLLGESPRLDPEP